MAYCCTVCRSAQSCLRTAPTGRLGGQSLIGISATQWGNTLAWSRIRPISGKAGRSCRDGDRGAMPTKTWPDFERSGEHATGFAETVSRIRSNSGQTRQVFSVVMRHFGTNSARRCHGQCQTWRRRRSCVPCRASRIGSACARPFDLCSPPRIVCGAWSAALGRGCAAGTQPVVASLLAAPLRCHPHRSRVVGALLVRCC